MDHSNDKAKPMKITELNWRTSDDGETWILSGYVTTTVRTRALRRLFELQYLGRTRVAFGGGHERWKVYDRRYWIDDPQDIPEFNFVHEAKAWVEAVVRLDP
jgi:hypothetical protein